MFYAIPTVNNYVSLYLILFYHLSRGSLGCHKNYDGREIKMFFSNLSSN